MEVLFNDLSVVVCIKPSGISAQDDGINSMPSLLCRHLGIAELYTVHRLDRKTSGIMVYARTKTAAAALSMAIQQGHFKKVYLAVLEGVLYDERGNLEDLLYYDRIKNKSYVVKRMRKGVRRASLDYKVIQVAEDKTLTQVCLHTGRTHQIRVQFASRGFPLVGDTSYGAQHTAETMGLWAAKLMFPHPETNEIMTFCHCPPEVYPWTAFTQVKL